jgi:ATP-dependent RNA helicase RhlE
MLDLGFIHALRKIAAMVGTPRQTLLFSATMPKTIEQLAKAFLVDPVRVETATPGKPAEKVAQFVHFVPQARKADLLKELLLRDPAHLSLVFARTKHGTEKLMKNLVAAGIDAVSIHGNKSQGQRERAIREFRDGEARVLVATDVAARGIDIPGVSHVYNHDLPEVPEAYVHRIGRTARAGAAGEAVSLCAPDEAHLLRAVEKLTGIVVHRLNEPAAQQRDSAAPAGRDERRQREDRPQNGKARRRGKPRQQAQGAPRDAEVAHVRVSERNYQPRTGNADEGGAKARPSGSSHSNGGSGHSQSGHGRPHGGTSRPQRPQRQNRRPGRVAAY